MAWLERLLWVGFLGKGLGASQIARYFPTTVSGEWLLVFFLLRQGIFFFFGGEGAPESSKFNFEYN